MFRSEIAPELLFRISRLSAQPPTAIPRSIIVKVTKHACQKARWCVSLTLI